MHIDGSVLEGGGQIVRVSIALATLLNQPLTITSIRGKRSKPGLAAQHITSVNAASSLVRGKLEGNIFRSCNLSFTPLQNIPLIQDQSFKFVVDTAGSASLVIQAMLPVLLLCPRSSSCHEVAVDVVGGTNVGFSPPIDHTIHVLLPLLKRMNIPDSVVCSIERRGWNPTGGGRVSIRSPCRCTFPRSTGAHHHDGDGMETLTGLQLTDRGKIVSVCAYVACSSNNRDIVDGAQISLLTLCRALVVDFCGADEGARVDIQVFADDTTMESKLPTQARSGGKRDAGGELCVQLCVVTSSGCRLSRNLLQRCHPGDVPKRIRRLVDSMRGLIVSGACIDEHTADQLLVYMALSNSPSQLLVEPLDQRTSSLHIDSTVHVLQKFLKKGMFKVTVQSSGCRLIECSP